jgi:hypothetical protein
MGVVRRTLRKCLQKFFCENRISGRKTRFSQKFDRIFTKFPRLNRENWIPRKTFFSDFRNFSATIQFSQKSAFLRKILKNWRFAKISVFAKIGNFAKIGIFAKNT